MAKLMRAYRAYAPPPPSYSNPTTQLEGSKALSVALTHMALGKCYEDMESHEKTEITVEEAFNHYSKANQVRRMEREAKECEQAREPGALSRAV